MSKLLKEKEAAEILARSVQTLRNERVERRGVPYHKFGRSVRYAEDDLREYISRHRIEPEPA